MRRTQVAASLLVLGIVAAACGNGDGDGDDPAAIEEEYVEAFAATRADDDFTNEETACIARALVDAVGVERLEPIVTPTEIRDNPERSPVELGATMNDEQMDLFWADLNTCVNIRELFIEGIAADGDVSDQAMACLEGAIDDDFLKPLIVTLVLEGEEALQEDDELVATVFSLFSECPEAADG
jgi:hypothetical protein